jgi:hypothetical protein
MVVASEAIRQGRHRHPEATARRNRAPPLPSPTAREACPYVHTRKGLALRSVGKRFSQTLHTSESSSHWALGEVFKTNYSSPGSAGSRVLGSERVPRNSEKAPFWTQHGREALF